jgi:hypothetical protein
MNVSKGADYFLYLDDGRTYRGTALESCDLSALEQWSIDFVNVVGLGCPDVKPLRTAFA